jgi:hypothetical protein
MITPGMTYGLVAIYAIPLLIVAWQVIKAPIRTWVFHSSGSDEQICLAQSNKSRHVSRATKDEAVSYIGCPKTRN